MRAGTINCESNLPGLSKYGGVGTVKMLDMLYALLSKERHDFYEGQAGFRSGGYCINNIFTLN